MQQSKRRRLSAEAWRGLVDRFEAGGLPAEGFCQQEGISLSSLNRWRLKFRRGADERSAKLSARPVATAAAVEFVDLGALRAGGSRIELRLEFGGGVVLQLSRG